MKYLCCFWLFEILQELKPSSISLFESRSTFSKPNQLDQNLNMIFILLALVALAQAAPRLGARAGGSLIRFPCSQIVIDRIDP